MLKSLRDTLERHRILIRIGAIVLILLSLGYAALQLMKSGNPMPPRQRTVWFEDVTTGERFRDDVSKIPPIQSPQGHDAVRIYLYQHPGEKEPFVGLYEKYTEEGKKQLKQLQKYMKGESASQTQATMASQSAQKNHLMSVDGKQWYSAADPRFYRLFKAKVDSANPL